MSSRLKKSLLAAACITVAGLIIAVVWGPNRSVAAEPAKSEQEIKAAAKAVVETHMDQWKRKNPGRVDNWVKEEKERHAIQPPADNSDLLKGEQGKGHSYGNYTERDILIWAQETEKMVVEGSRIFHSADLLGGTIGVSCDMCHPDASNTHPETYPKFQAQMGRVALLRDMVNWCIEHPVRGKAFSGDDPKMRALEAYIIVQRKGVPLNYGKH